MIRSVLQPRKVLHAVAVFAAAPLLVFGAVVLVQLDLTRGFLRVAGFVVGGLKDDIGVLAAVSIVVLSLVWLAILLRCLMEARADVASQNRRENRSHRV